MGMSTHVVGFKPPDEEWKKMKKVYDACVAAGVEIPEKVDRFFGYEGPDDSGVEVDLEKNACVSLYNDDMRNGFEVDVKKLPQGVSIIRFYNSY